MAEKNADDIFKLIKDEDVEYVDIRFCDLPGVVLGPRRFRSGQPGSDLTRHGPRIGACGSSPAPGDA